MTQQLQTSGTPPGYAVRRRRLDRRGSAMVETAIVLPLLLLLLMSVLEFGRLFYVKITVESAVREATRFAVTGNALADPDDGAKDLPRPEAIRQYVLTHAPGVDIDKSKITLDPADGGGPGQVVKVTVEHRFEFVTPLLGKYFTGDAFVFDYTSTMKNEPVFTSKRRA